jgi:predicted metal-binding membrane protein
MSGGPASGRRGAHPAVLLLVAAAAAWVWAVARWGGMRAMPGTMGLGLPAFLAVWTLMMAAMMLPATAPVAGLYARTITVRRAPRMVVFTVAYLLVWAAAGLPAYALAAGLGRAASLPATAGAAVASAVFAVGGVYQLTPLKDRCLARCRSPIGLMLRYGSYRGTSRDLRAGAHHGAFCLGCCWSLMLVLAAFGLMNLWAMVVLAAVITAEKLAPAGRLVARAVGLASIALAVAVVWFPALAPGLTGGAGDMAGMWGGATSGGCIFA